jgi:hypothetical protein
MRYMDYNRFNGSDEDLKIFIGLPDPQPVACPLDGQPCTGGKYLETI